MALDQPSSRRVLEAARQQAIARRECFQIDAMLAAAPDLFEHQTRRVELLPAGRR